MRKQLPKSWIIKLFTKFQVIYTHKWISAIDTDELYELALVEWAEKLAGLTGEDIKRGLDNLKSEWPPSPQQFRELCVGDELHRTAAYKQFEPIKGIEMSKELKEEYRNKGRDILREIKESLK